MTNNDSFDIAAADRQAEAIVAAIQQAVRRALEDHKRTGDPVVFCENGNIRWVPAEEIEIPDEPVEG